MLHGVLRDNHDHLMAPVSETAVVFSSSHVSKSILIPSTLSWCDKELLPVYFVLEKEMTEVHLDIRDLNGVLPILNFKLIIRE